MSSLKDSDKDEFWEVVEECLVEIHGLPKQKARHSCEQTRKAIDPATIRDQIQNSIPDILYHREPFDVSCDIAQRHLDIRRYRGQYNHILDSHNW